MLKKFFLNTLSSFMGAWIALVLFGIVAVLVCIGLVAKLGISSSSNKEVSKGSILVINLRGSLIENELPAEIDYFSLLDGGIEKSQTLAGLKSAIKAAKENKNISAIYLKCEGVSASPATLNSLRNSLNDFKSSGKKIIAYADNFLMGDYYVASCADNLYMNPCGSIYLKGLGTNSIYFKKLFDKLGIEFQVAKVGTYKSAVEPYILPEMSEPARAQLDTLFGNMWLQIREGISGSRSQISEEQIDSLVNNFISLKNATFDKKEGLIDALYYERSMDSIINILLGKKYDRDINFVSPSLLAEQEMNSISYSEKNQIAVLYAVGEIVDGGGMASINYERMVPQIVSLADDKNIKGLVLRVNSPGGSVFGSQQIGEALDYFQSKGKPLAVSMGDYAASGGYWISCHADRIFANPLTITGSIGIFGLIPNVKGLLDKIGINPQLVATNPDAQFPTLFYPLNERQLSAMQKMVEEGYDEFVNRVATGRHMPESKVRIIGEGRVWDAQKALQLGLIDELGDVEMAIEWIADKLDLDNYGVSYFPRIESSWMDYISGFQTSELFKILNNNMSDYSSTKYVDFVYQTITQNPVQAKMPDIKIIFGEK